MRLENWILLFDNRITGKAYGNPNFEDGAIVIATPVKYRNDKDTGVLTRSGSEYILGNQRIMVLA